MLIHPTAARSVSTRTHRKDQPQDDSRRVQREISDLTDDLRNLDARITEIAQGLPASGNDFDVLAELADGLRCVQTDLLADAIKTLESLAYDDEATLRAQYEERHRLFEIVNG